MIATDQPLVSVVIPTFNRLERLTRVLEALAAQTYPADRIEIVVVSDGSSDGTDEFLKNGATPLPLVAVQQANAGPAVARNNGVEAASGELLLFVDDDVIPTPPLIAEHVRSHLRSKGDMVVIGPMMTPPDHEMSPWVRWEQTMLEKQYDAMRKGRWTATARQFYTGNASMSRSLFLRSGGFDESFRRAEDVELAYRLEHEDVEFEMNLDAIGFHHAVRSFDSWLAIASAYGSANVVFGRDHDRPDLLRTIARDYRRRNPLNRLVSWLGVRSDRFAAIVSSGLRRGAGVAERRGFERLNRYALSGIYNVAFCRGVAEELGGAKEFGVFIRQHHPLLGFLTKRGSR